MHITFEKLLYREDYQIKLDHIVMNEENGNRLALYFRGHTDEVMVLIGDYSCNYFELLFEADCVLLRAPDLYELDDGLEYSTIPIVMYKDSALLTFATAWMGLKRDPSQDWTHYAIRAFEDDIHILSPRPPVFTDLGHKMSDYVVKQTLNPQADR
ncbi:hypothetical protein [Exiguobacterium sp. s193]|uniref:hypothetical protein n=1 Tax=Exiguobacterium sp. s193 TaxID=2751207 RepID=UPI001BE8617A|nr:hypothetical protein [Exiguobacterium sp. s193]